MCNNERGRPIFAGGGGEQRTLRIAAKHADLTHWFALGPETLKHKIEVLEGYCEAIGGDPTTIERTIEAPVIVAESETAARALTDRVPPDRRAFVTAGTPAQAADGLRPYLDAGFTGFTFNNTITGRQRRSDASASCSTWSPERRRAARARRVP